MTDKGAFDGQRLELRALDIGPQSRRRHLVMREPDLRIDEHNFVVFRDRDSSRATDPIEIEANQFAAAFLMPEELLRDAVLRLGEKPSVEDAIRLLAEKFNVSREAELLPPTGPTPS